MRLKPLQCLNLLRHEPGNTSFKGSPIDDTFRTDVIIKDKNPYFISNLHFLRLKEQKTLSIELTVSQDINVIRNSFIDKLPVHQKIEDYWPLRKCDRALESKQLQNQQSPLAP
jgi:hypothetical protein